MHTIITHPAREAHPDLDAVARRRAERRRSTGHEF